MAEQEQIGAIHVAPGVLTTIAALTALAVPGVASLSSPRMGWPWRPKRPLDGVRLQIKDDAVLVDIYIVVEPGYNMYQVGTQVQKEISQAILHMVGMPVQEVNVYIQDVA